MKHKNLVALSCELSDHVQDDELTKDIGTCIAAGGLYCLTPALTVWAGLNTAGQTKRAAAISLVFLFAAIGGIPGSYIYLAKEARRFDSALME